MTSSSKGFNSTLDRREFLTQGSMIMGALAGAVTLRPRLGFTQERSESYVVAETTAGRIRGIQQGGIVIFKGVPYGGPVSGANRFKAAPPLESWTGVKDALQLGPPSWQPDKSYFGINEPSPDENCLVLNIWTPAIDGRRRPVMFYNHGGGFIKGSGGAVYQDGGNLARMYDVVVVETNHRLGLLGYLYLGELGGEEYSTSGNQGLLDLRDGLRWVNENIEGFGGDPNNVMIFGESGGGQKTSALYALPSADKYFNKASIESGPAISMTPLEVAARTTQTVLKLLGLEKRDWRKLIDVPVDKLLSTQVSLAEQSMATFNLTSLALRQGGGWMLNFGFAPVVDGSVLPHDPFSPTAPAFSKAKPLIVGTNRDESAFIWFQAKLNDVFSLNYETLKARLDKDLGSIANADMVLATYRRSRPHASAPDLYTAITTATAMWLPAITIAERKYAQGGAPAYMYMFSHPSNFLIPGTNHPIGAAHATEIPYKFDNIHPVGQESHADVQQPGSNIGMDTMIGTDKNREKVAHNMSEMWSSFARTGQPAAKGQPAWPAYTTKTRATMEIDAQCKIVNDPFDQERRMWEHLDA